MGCFQVRSAAAVAVAVSTILLIGCEAASSVGPSSSAPQHEMRKLLSSSGGYSTARMSADECSEEDIVVYQSPAPPLPSGIPAFSVEVINLRPNCTVSDVHIACGGFASTTLINPALFQRVAMYECVVRQGGPLAPGEIVLFEYSQSLPYNLENVVSVSCN